MSRLDNWSNPNHAGYGLGSSGPAWSGVVGVGSFDMRSFGARETRNSGLLVLSMVLFVACAGAGQTAEETTPPITTGTASATSATVLATTSLSVEPPWSIETIELPDDPETITAVFAAMPSEVDGVPLEIVESDVSFPAVSYQNGEGRSLRLSALSIAELREFAGEDMTTQEFLAGIADSGEIEDVESNLESSLDEPGLVWMAGSSPLTIDGTTTTQYVATWTRVDGAWMFTVVADTPEGLTALVHAFIEATRAAG